MTAAINTFVLVVITGMGATFIMDIWLQIQKQLKIPTLNFALLGRWLGHVLRGMWQHTNIAQSKPIRHEKAMGWLAHYLIGIVFAFLLVAFAGTGWLASPTPGPALLTGIITVAAPLFLLQPAMGAGIASSKTKTPALNCVKSLVNHIAFGYGLYLAAEITAILNLQLN